MAVAKLKQHVIERTIGEIRLVAPATDDCTYHQILAEISECYPGFQNGESNLLENSDEEAVFDARRAIRHSRTLTTIIFNIDPHPSLYPAFWDSSTLQLKAALDKYVTESDTVVEIGVGHVAINCLYLLKQYPHLKIFGTDVDTAAVTNAAMVARHNSLDFTPIASDMWERIPKDKYDCVFMNPPYVPTSKLYLVRRTASPLNAADGGQDGMEVIRGFVEGLRVRCWDDTKVLLSINTYFVNQENIECLFNEHRFGLKDVICQQDLPNRALVFVPV